MQENTTNIPYIVHEAEMSRQERTIRRLWVVSIVMILSLVATNGAWLVYCLK